MAEYWVGDVGDFRTLAAAAAAVQPGDTVRIKAGIYREALALNTEGVTWLGESGAVIDGGWDGKTITNSWGAQVSFGAANVTVRGLLIRNCPGRAVGITGREVRGDDGKKHMVMAHGATLENCILEDTYRGALLLGDSSKEKIRDVTIRGVTLRRMSRMWVVGDRGPTGRNVNGSFNIHNAHDCLIEDCVLYEGYGEGINVGRGSRNVILRRNILFSTAHVLLYVNRAEGTQFIKNIIYHIPDPTYGGSKESEGGGFVIGDEGGRITSQSPASHGTVIRGNVVVNCGVLFHVRNNVKNYNTQLLNTIVENNTFIAGPSTRQGIMIKANPHGRPHRNSFFRNNVIDFTFAPAGVSIGTHPQGSGITFEGNAWSRQVPAAMRSASDVVGDLGIVRADAARDKFDVDNYRPRPGSPLVAGGRLIGALGVAGDEPPVEPPDDPDPPVEPPDDPEPPVDPEPIDPVPALKEALAQGELVLKELQVEHEKGLASVESLAQQIVGVEMMLGQLDELIALFEDGE